MRTQVTFRLGLSTLFACAAALAACGDDEVGSYCCDCRCCDADVHLTRDDQSWPNCDEPCRRTCEQELGCQEMVETAVSCNP
jgi:hypothetical protein